jgi:heme exporter protein A
MDQFTGEAITCVRSERRVFARLSFSVGAGEALVLIGPNGAGKSSLLRLMAGLLRPCAGRLLWNGEAIADDAEAHRGRVHYVGHADAIKPALTVAEHLGFWAAQRGGTADQSVRVDGALAALGIARRAALPARFLSAGQRRRLALARLLATDAAIWLLDEPRTALDRDAAAQLDAMIASQRARGGLVILALHGGDHPPGARVLDLAPFAAEA